MGCKPEKPESMVASPIGIEDKSCKPVKAKLKPLIAPGFLGMDSVSIGCKPEKPESTVASPIGTEDESGKPVKAKLKPLIAPGFLGKRPRKILDTKKDVPVNGFKNIAESNGESVILVNGGSNDLGKEGR